MWWECCGCGAQIERLRAPEACSECGRSSIIVKADEGLPDDPGWASLWQLWTQRALARGASSESSQGIGYGVAQPAE